MGTKYGGGDVSCRRAYERMLTKMREVTTLTKALDARATERLLLGQAFTRHFQAIQDRLPIVYIENSRLMLVNALLAAGY